MGRMTIRRAVAALAAAFLLFALWTAWGMRPAAPALPRSLSAPLSRGDIGSLLALLAWGIFVLLDLILVGRVLQFGIRRQPSRGALRLQRAFAPRGGDSSHSARPDWRAFARTIDPPVLRIAHGGRESPAETPAPRPVPAPVLVEAAKPASTSEERTHIRLLGPFEVAGAHAEQPQRKAARELIAYLALQRQGATRDELLEALWPHEDPRRSEQRFWQASAEARKALGDAVHRDGRRYLLNRATLDIDLDRLDHLIGEAGQAAKADDRRAALEAALNLFRGEPFTGIETDWAESEARRLRAVAVDILKRLARLRLDAAEHAAALDAAERGIALDSLNEDLWRLALEAEGALGSREAITERYERLQHLLDEKLGLEPQRETRTLYRELLGQT
jgi:DNA-binding SARP family transcriptional activator